MKIHTITTLFVFALYARAFGAPPQHEQNKPDGHPQPHPQAPAHAPAHQPEHAPAHQPEHAPANFVPRSPSMSRTYSPPRQQQQPHANAPQLENLRQQVQQFAHNRPLVSKPVDVNALQAKFKNNTTIAQNVASRVRSNHPGANQWFGSNFFQQHHTQPNYWNQRSNWWHGADWNRVHRWYGWQNPIYYDDGGYPTEINYDVNNTNINYYPAPVEGEETANAVDNWLPLGVFSVGSDPTQAAYSNTFIQLAADQSYNIAGTYYNATTDTNYPIEGAIDPTTQQVYWRIAQAPTSPIMTTGLYNLTQPVANIQVNFPGGYVQNWVLVKINQ